MANMSETPEAADTPPVLPVVRTVLIADVRGYTQFTNEHGVPAAARLADRFAHLCQVTVSQHEGQVIEFRGDEALAVFSSPRSALRAAIALQGRFREEREADASLPLRVGMGIDIGEVVPIRGGYRGKALNLASRLCTLAGPGETFSTEEVVQEAERIEGLAYMERGRVQLKGFPDPIRVIHILLQEDLPEHFPRLVSLIAKPTNLPLQTTPFIGREREGREVAALLRREEVRLVTLTGAGGTGKTRLALQVGGAVLDDFERGVFFVNLAPLTDPDLVSSIIAASLKVKEVPGQDILATLKDYLKDRQLLLVLDNFEHLVPAATVVHELLVGCPRLTVLVTSRAVLRLSAEREYPVPPLAVPDPKHLPPLEHLGQYDAVALFTERAQAVKPDFTVTKENAPAVAEICSRLDGLPLALELAAARIKLFQPEALLLRLGERLALLTGGSRDLPHRQQTLRAALDWSYALLTPGAQTLFARLGVFAGLIDPEAAAAVCGEDQDTMVMLERLADLADQSLLESTADPTPRFRLLQTVREYALAHLAESSEGDTIRERHLHLHLALAEKAALELTGRDQAAWLERLDRDVDNLRIALGWAREVAQTEQALRLAGALVRFWVSRGYWTEGREWLTSLLAREDAVAVPAAVRALACHGVGLLANVQGDLSQAVQWLEQGIALHHEAGDPIGAVRAVNTLSGVAFDQGDFATAARLFEKCVAQSRAANDAGEVARALGNLGEAYYHLDELERAAESYQEALAIARQAGRSDAEAFILGDLGNVAHRRGDLTAAAALHQAALRMKQTLGDRRQIAITLEDQAALAATQGQLERGARLLGAATKLRVTIGSQRPASEESAVERTAAGARAMLGKEAYAAEFAAGEALSLTESIAYALEM